MERVAMSTEGPILTKFGTTMYKYGVHMSKTTEKVNARRQPPFTLQTPIRLRRLDHMLRCGA